MLSFPVFCFHASFMASWMRCRLSFCLVNLLLARSNGANVLVLCDILTDIYDCNSSNATQVCSDIGVDCDGSQFDVIKLDLSSRNLTGELFLGVETQWPASLQSLNLSNNNLFGEFYFGRFSTSNESSLSAITINNNNFNSIPNIDSTRLSKLKTLDISHNNITNPHDIDFRALLNNFESLEYFDASDNNLEGNVDLTNIYSSPIEYFNITMNKYNSNRYLNGSDNYLTFYNSSNATALSAASRENITISIDTALQCNPLLYCDYTSFIPLNRSRNVCHSATDCQSTCQCESICDNKTQTNETYQICEMIKYLNGILWYEWNNVNYCNQSIDGSVAVVCDGDGNMIKLDFSNQNLAGELNMDNVTFPTRIEMFDFSNNLLSGYFNGSRMCINRGSCNLRYLDVSNNQLTGISLNLSQIQELYVSNNRIDRKYRC